MGAEESKKEPEKRGNTSVPSRNNERALRFSMKLCGGAKTASSKHFMAYFPAYSHPFILRLFGLSSSGGDEISQEQVTGIVDKMLSPRSTSSLTRLFLQAYSQTDTLQEIDIKHLIATALHLFLVTCDVSPSVISDDEKAVDIITQSIMSKQTIEGGLSWIETNCPDLLLGMHQWVVSHIGAQEETQADDKAEYLMEDHAGALLSVGLWWLMCSSLPSLYTHPVRNTTPTPAGHASQSQTQSCQPWTLLYNSREHGLSVNRLQHHVMGYRGPTVLIISCQGGYLYAVAIDTEWREGTMPWGGSSCTVIKISPDYTILEEGANIIVFNERSRNIPKGLFIGRDQKRRILSLTEGLQAVTHQGQSGHVVNAEVWGCGSADVKLAQVKQKKTELKDAERNAKVKLPGQWDDNPDRLLLGWGTARTDYADGYREDRK